MNFFSTSLFSDFKIPDLLSLPQAEEDGDAHGDDDEDVPDEQNHSSSPPGQMTRNSSSIQDAASSASHTGTLPSTQSEIEISPNDTELKKEPEPVPEPESGLGLWNFGGLVKSIALRSEGMLQVYKKDLEEFRVGLQNETKMIKDVAIHAVKDLPTSIETGTSIAKESIGSVGFGQVMEDISTFGQAIEDFSSSVLRGTVDIISQGKEAVLKLDDEESSTFMSPHSSSSTSRYENSIPPIPLSGGKYSRFEVQAMSLQHDTRTYCDEPEDVADFMLWKSSFLLSEREEEIRTLVANNAFLNDIFVKLVPDVVVDEETFWMRYFYKFHKLRQTEAARENLVKRASAQVEEDLSWDTEEEEVEEEVITDKNLKDGKASPSEIENLKECAVESEHKVSAIDPETIEGKDLTFERDIKDKVLPSSSEMIAQTKQKDELKSDGNPKEHFSSENLAAKVANEDEDDLGWEVPEDSEEPSSKRSSNSEASWEVPDIPKDEVKRKLSIHDHDEEDLSWDVDDDDDHDSK